MLVPALKKLIFIVIVLNITCLKFVKNDEKDVAHPGDRNTE